MSSAYGRAHTPWRQHPDCTAGMTPSDPVGRGPRRTALAVLVLAVVGAGAFQAVAGGPDGQQVLDDRAPAVARLDPDLLAALHRAATDAAADGVRLQVNSGWRSAEQQARLLAEAVDEHGSLQEAARWVATPETSAHVSGDAVDVGPSDAARWLSRHGSSYGLCQVYRNEPWHFELRPGALDEGCPAMYADPTRDPRMQR